MRNGAAVWGIAGCIDEFLVEGMEEKKLGSQIGAKIVFEAFY